MKLNDLALKDVGFGQHEAIVSPDILVRRQPKGYDVIRLEGDHPPGVICMDESAEVAERKLNEVLAT